jgi:hypothetical protein
MFPRLGKTIAALAVLGAIAIGASAVASAASNSTSSGSSANSGQGTPPAGQPAPQDLSHGPGETLLTGDTAAKVKQAALEKVPGATVLRVETDSGGSAYEAHLQKSDGSFTTVEVNKDFQVTSVDGGFGPGPGGGAPPNGAPPGASN